MASGVTRREALRIALAGAGALAVGRASWPTGAGAAPTGLATGIATAATQFLQSLEGDALHRATYSFDDAERMRWHWTNTVAFPRNGLPFEDMTATQREYALDLLRASSSAAGYKTSLDIVQLQGVLLQEQGAGPQWSPDRYYVTVFGRPGGAEPWGWRFEGHHLSRHYTVVGDRLAVYPFFLGAWPTRVSSAYGDLPVGYRTMPREEDAARQLVRSLGSRQRRVAIFQQESLTNHVTQNEPRVTPLAPVGIRVSELAAPHRRLVSEIVSTYMAVLPKEQAQQSRARIDRAGFDRLRFGWAGSLEPHHPQYYRLQGPTFLLEFDNSRNEGTHIHSVWRDFSEDFGRNLT
jgi:hypothetical protein